LGIAHAGSRHSPAYCSSDKRGPPKRDRKVTEKHCRPSVKSIRAEVCRPNSPKPQARRRTKNKLENAKSIRMSFDTIIRGGTVATASDTFHCDVGISGGRIAALGDNLGAANAIVDAHEKLVLPGGIDSHVHLAQPSGPGIVMADDFTSGTRSAAFGGNTMVL